MSPRLPSGEGFRRVFGRPPEGTWSAPGRVNLIGEFTDYNDGFVLPLALPLATQASAARRDDSLVRIASAQRSESGESPIVEALLDILKPGTSGSWASYVLGVVWALRAAGAELAGVDLFIDSAVPIGAGLSSSAALECSVALALHDLYELPLSRQELALVAQRAENEYVGVPTGIMDQTASLLCRSGHALFLDTRTFEVRQVPLDLEPAGLTLLVVNTGVKHALGNSAYADRVRDCRRAAQELGVAALRDVPPETMDTALARIDDEVVRRRARHVISEQSRVLEVVRLLESGRPAEVGQVLSAGHRSLRDDYEVSCVELDTVVDVAVANGALGARMTGGGFGGSAVVLVGLAKAEAVETAIADAFAARGYSHPQTIEIVASDGASRIA
ncbi:MAG: galactokinase [Acidimicrobiales bacterium]|jgi:galactokinase